MPITYSIDSNQGVIFEQWFGEVSTTDLANYWRMYLADPTVLTIRKTVVDLRGSTPTFTGVQLASLIQEIVLPVLAGRDWITAIVVNRPVQFGFSRQYQVFAECFSRDAIFTEPDQALKWVQSVAQAPDR